MVLGELPRHYLDFSGLNTYRSMHPKVMLISRGKLDIEGRVQKQDTYPRIGENDSPQTMYELFWSIVSVVSEAKSPGSPRLAQAQSLRPIHTTQA